MAYRLYIDEVGSSAISNTISEQERYLSLTGIIFDQEYVSTIVFPAIESLKKRFFKSHPDEPIILHRKELVNRKYPFSSLKDPEIEKAFNEEFLGLLENFDYKVITVTIDKQQHRQRYRVWTFEPYHYCLAVMIERYVYWLRIMNTVGDVMAESRGGSEDKRLKASFEKAYTEGTKFISSEVFRKYLTSQQLKMKPKVNNIVGLQLADTIAHPSHRAMLACKEQRALAENFGSKIAKILEDGKYLRISGKVDGWGRKWLP